MDKNRLMRTLEQDEGYRQFPYKCTAGYLSCAIGRNLDTVGIRYSEARFMLKNDIEECIDDLRKILPGQFDSLPDYVQEVLINMRFNLGPAGFRGFRRFIGAIRVWDIQRAANEMEDSKWWGQVGDRAKRLQRILLHGFHHNS